MALDNQALQNVLDSLSGHPGANATTTPAVEAANNSTVTPQLLAGKYTNVEELERGYSHQMTETSKIIGERDRLKQELDMARSFIQESRMGTDRVYPAERAAGRKSAVASLAESLNADPEQLAAAMAEVSAQTFAPFTSGIRARQIVESESPGFSKFEPEVAQFLQANPDINTRIGRAISRVADDPEAMAAILDYTYLKYNASRQGVQKVGDASGQAQAAARIDATIPQSGGGNRAASSEAGSYERLVAAHQHGAETGDWTEFLNQRLTGVVPENHYDVNARG